MLSASDFLEGLARRGFGLFSGVPCSYLTPLMDQVQTASQWRYVAAANEGDAVAIAAQALTGRALGAGDAATTRRLTTRMTWWGLWSGVVTGAGLALAAPVLGPVFTSDPAVHDLLLPVLLTAALFQPVAGVVFVLDGVLIGAGDGVYLAWAGLLVLVAYAPVLLMMGSGTGLVVVWAVFGAVFIGTRCLVLVLRARGDRWLVLGDDPAGRP